MVANIASNMPYAQSAQASAAKLHGRKNSHGAANAGFDILMPVDTYETDAPAQDVPNMGDGWQPETGWLFDNDADREQIAAIRRRFGLNDRDNVNVILVSPHQNRIRPMNMIIRQTTSPRAEKLIALISRSQSRLSNLETGVQRTPGNAKTVEGCGDVTAAERRQQKNALRQDIRQTQRALSRERARIAALPRSGFIVAFRDE